jgi:hypothetical protein
MLSVATTWQADYRLSPRGENKGFIGSVGFFESLDD